MLVFKTVRKRLLHSPNFVNKLIQNLTGRAVYKKYICHCLLSSFAFHKLWWKSLLSLIDICHFFGKWSALGNQWEDRKRKWAKIKEKVFFWQILSSLFSPPLEDHSFLFYTNIVCIGQDALLELQGLKCFITSSNIIWHGIICMYVYELLLSSQKFIGKYS